MKPKRFDVILRDGQFLLNVPEHALSGLHIAKTHKLHAIHRLPWFGIVLRYMWGKAEGALLDSPRLYKPMRDL